MATGVRARLGVDVGVCGDGHRRSGRRDSREAGRPRLPARRDAGGERRDGVQLSGRPGDDPQPRGRGRAPPRAASPVTESRRITCESPLLASRAMIAFASSALSRSPPRPSTRSSRGRAQLPQGDVPGRPPREPPRHAGVPGRAPAARAAERSAPSWRRPPRLAAPIVLRPDRYRETRSVGMLVFDDEAGAATALARRSARAPPPDRRVRAGAAALAAARHRHAFPGAAASRPTRAQPRRGRSVRCGCLPCLSCGRPGPSTSSSRNSG